MIARSNSLTLPLVAASIMMMASLTSCSTGGTSISTVSTSNPATLATGGASTIFVIASGGTIVDSFSLTGTGAPATSLTLPSGFSASALAVDRSSSTLYVAGTVGTGNVTTEVLAYPVASTGTATASRTITEGMGNFPNPCALAVDSSGQLYINSGNSIAVYAANATGAATPVQLISGSSTQLMVSGASSSCFGIAVDSTANIYSQLRTTSSSATTDNIYIFANGSTGNVAPTRVITTTTPQLYGPVVDSVQSIYAIEESVASSANASIVKFSTGASGAATPASTITSTSFGYLGGLQRGWPIHRAFAMGGVQPSPPGSGCRVPRS